MTVVIWMKDVMNTENYRPRKRSNINKTAIRQTVKAAQDLGIDVAGIEVRPDGAIRVFDRSMSGVPIKDEFLKWDMAGRL